MIVGKEIIERPARVVQAMRSQLLSKALLLLTLFSVSIPGFMVPMFAMADGTAPQVNVWWPTNGAHVSGLQPFKALVSGLSPSQYEMYWQVDGGTLNAMSENDTDSPHKEASVDLTNWHWSADGTYTITFVAKEGGSIVAQQSETITLDGSPVLNAPAPATAVAAVAPTTQTYATVFVPTPTQTPAPTVAPAVSVTVPVTSIASSAAVNVWWPSANAQVTGPQPFKAAVSGLSLSQYQMYWQVDGGALNLMQDNFTDSPHKEASVDVTNWNWHGAGTYVVTFVAKENGNVIAQLSEPIIVNGGTASAPVPTVQTSTVSAQIFVPQTQTFTVTAASSASSVSVSTNNSTTNLYVDPSSSASQNAGGDSAIQMLAAEPTAKWFGNWNSNIYNDVHSTVTAAAAQGAMPVLVAYNIPERDCGGFSSGGSNNPSGYQSWIGSFASAIGSSKAIVILEPDALAQINCLNSADQATRLSLLSGAVSALKANGNTKVYIDAGHSNWIDAATMASNLQKANIARADGFSLNVSNFMGTSNEVNYGQQISGLVGGKHFVVDTSRNGGNVSSGEWCNPQGAAIGQKPTLQTGSTVADAYLWIKTPGESDGNCNGGPGAGQWWSSYADTLVHNAH